MISVFIILVMFVLGKVVVSKGISPDSANDAGFWTPLFGVRGALVVYHLPLSLVGVSAVLAIISMVHYIVKNRHIFATPDTRTDTE